MHRMKDSVDIDPELLSCRLCPVLLDAMPLVNKLETFFWRTGQKSQEN